MKKFLFSFAIIASLSIITASAQRFGAAPAGDPTGQSVTYVSKSITIGSTDSISPNASFSYYTIPVAAAKTLIIKNLNAQKWDRCLIQFTADATTRLITLQGTKMLSDINRDTISVMSSRSSTVEYYYNGTKWVQITRYQQH
jgi:hypothetical protein